MSGFIKGAKIWNRIESKHIVASDNTESAAIFCGAFPADVSVKFSLGKNITAERVSLFLLCDKSGDSAEYPLSRGKDGVFSVTLSMSAISSFGRLFFYKYEIYNSYGTFYVLHDPEDFSDRIYENEEDGEYFQLSVYKRREKYPDFFRGGIVYQIFPDRFFRGGNEPAAPWAVMNDDWYGGKVAYCENGDENFKNNMFFGGDLCGIEQKLPYIASLGVTTLYLNPIFVSSSNHKYDTADYLRVDPMFGGDGALLSLLSSAKKCGINIILDGVFNHTGDDSVYFNKYGNYDSVGAFQSEKSPYYDWYNFYSFPEKYESWWGFSNLPRVKSDNPSYREFLFGKDGVIRKYIREGICGWRIDVADELSDDFLEGLSSAAREEKSDAIVIGEVWEDASNKIAYSKRRSYFSGKELDSVMNYPMRNAIIDYVRNGDYKRFLLTSNTLYYNYPREVTNVLFNVLGTHDTKRIITALAGADSDGLSKKEMSEKIMTPEEYSLGVKRLKLAYFILSFIPGVPCIYYGDEIGMEGEDDPFNRRPYPWGMENTELLGFYRKTGAVRRREKMLEDADFEVVFADEELLVFERKKNGETLVCIVNRSDKNFKFTCDANAFDVFEEKTGEKFCIGPLSCACFKINSEIKYGITVEYEK